mgnify:CR=1 FL=1
MTTEIAQFTASRIPFHPAIQSNFGIDKGQWRVLTDVLYPAAESADSIAMVLSYCKARQLDVMKKPFHIVPVWDSKKRKLVETVWPSIGELRTTAFRTGEYAGKDETEFGESVKKSWTNGDGEITDVTFPEWAQVTVYRIIKGNVCKFVGPKVRWLETFASLKSGAPNDRWKRSPFGQIEKCAEAAALRLAFPEEIGNDYAAEEMEGQSITIAQPKESTIIDNINSTLKQEKDDLPNVSDAAKESLKNLEAKAAEDKVLTLEEMDAIDAAEQAASAEEDNRFNFVKGAKA